MNSDIKLIDSWKSRLNDEFEKEYMLQLQHFLLQQKQLEKQILPSSNLCFNALNTTPYESVKVVILGQDPYPTPGHAHGLCFSVLDDVKPIPKSLINIYKELEDDLGIVNKSGYLQSWAEQGVLLLNSVLTVEAGHANAHQGKGWEQFTDVIISHLNQSENKIIFVLWGAYAQKKGQIIDSSKHLVLCSPHPSPLSAYRGFFGSKPFSQINQFLKKNNRQEVNWQITNSLEQ